MLASRKPKDHLQIEADLYAAIATMDKLSGYFDKGLVEETLLRRQLKACVSDVFKARMQLQKLGFDMDEFITREKLAEKFPAGMRRLDLVEGLNQESVSMNYDMKDLPAKTADFVANSIELIDLLKLRTVAKVEYIVPLLDEIHSVMTSFPKVPKDHWTVVEINGWRGKLVDETPSSVLPNDQCEKLEFEASRWLNEFRRMLKEM